MGGNNPPMKVKHCKFCRGEFATDSKHWYRNGRYYQCRKRQKLRMRKQRKGEHDVDAQAFREEKRRADALRQQEIPRMDHRWTPLNWREVCREVARQCPPEAAETIIDLAGSKMLTDKQWLMFESIHRSWVGPVTVVMLSEAPLRPKMQTAEIPPGFQVKRYAPVIPSHLRRK